MSGQWSKEPPTEPGWYWQSAAGSPYLEARYITRDWIMDQEQSGVKMLHLRWLPLDAPAPPEE